MRTTPTLAILGFLSLFPAGELSAQTTFSCKRCPWDPATMHSIRPPFNGNVVVFFAAHPDDETIGMSASIMHEVAAGKRVFIEMMTDGRTSTVHGRLNDGSTCTWHSGQHSYLITAAQFGQARLDEFYDSAIRMGVEGVYFNNAPSGTMTAAQVTPRINYWITNAPNVELRGVAGSDWLDPGTVGGTGHPDHIAVWDALVAAAHPNTLGYLIYNYRTLLNRHDYTVNYTALCAAKQNALDAYRVWQPSDGRYAVGFHSTPYLMDHHNLTLTPPPASCPEFVVIP